MKSDNKALWIIIGIAVGLVIAMSGMLVYNKYVNNKEDTNNKTEDKVNNNQENIDLTGYTELDINKNNVAYFFEYYNKNFDNEVTLLDGTKISFAIENDKLYVVNGETKSLIKEIRNPQKISLISSDYPSCSIYVINDVGELFATKFDYSSSEINIDNILGEIKNNLEKIKNVYGATDIKIIEPKHNTPDGPSILYPVVNIGEFEYVVSDELIKLSNFSYINWLNNDGSIKNILKNNNNIKVKRIIIEGWDDTYFLDKNNYLYSVEDKSVNKINDKKVTKIYYNPKVDYSADEQIIKVFYEDGNHKDYSITNDYSIIAE